MTVDVLFLAWNRLEFTRRSFELLVANTAWPLVRRLVVIEDGSTDGTREYLDSALRDVPAAAELVYLGFRSPVATMNWYLDEDPADAFAKIDNDIAVPPGWLEAMTGVLEEHPELDLLGMEAGQTRLPQRGTWDGTYSYREARHIGGVGLMRSKVFYPRPKPQGRFGFTEWQHSFAAAFTVRGWIEPDLMVPQLDRIPVEPWVTLSNEYVENGWQRVWPLMDARFAHPYYDWLEAS